MMSTSTLWIMLATRDSQESYSALVTYGPSAPHCTRNRILGNAMRDAVRKERKVERAPYAYPRSWYFESRLLARAAGPPDDREQFRLFELPFFVAIGVIGGPSRPFRVSVCAERTLNATGQSRVTLSLRQDQLRAGCGPRQEEKCA